MRRAVLALALLAAPLATNPARAQTWLADPPVTLPSTDTGWHDIAIDPAARRLFVARRADGLLAFDVAKGTAATVKDTEGANAVVLLPTPGRAYAATTTGDLITFDPATLAPLGRTALGAGDIQSGLFEPTRNRVHFQTAPNGEKTAWITVDAATGQVLARTEFNSRQMGTPATDDAGAIYAPLRDRGLVQQLAADDLAVQKTFKLAECTDPVATRWDASVNRLLLLCGGDKAALVALDPKAGVVASVPLGRGTDGVARGADSVAARGADTVAARGADSIAIDPQRHLIVVANGTEGTLTVIAAAAPAPAASPAAPAAYAIVETIGTRPGARQVAFDPANGRLYTAAATTTLPAPTADNKQPIPIHHPDSFTILSFHPATPTPVP